VWRLAGKRDLDAEWRIKDENRYARVRGDFNGDGVVDEARLVVSPDGKRLGVMVCLGDDDKDCRVLDEADRAQFSRRGISLLPPGRYETACGIGYMECQPGEPESVNIRHDAIQYFFYDSASSVFFFDDARGEFRRVWIGD
jgi:hypothetical protein